MLLRCTGTKCAGAAMVKSKKNDTIGRLDGVEHRRRFFSKMSDLLGDLHEHVQFPGYRKIALHEVAAARFIRISCPASVFVISKGSADRLHSLRHQCVRCFNHLLYAYFFSFRKLAADHRNGFHYIRFAAQ